MTSQGEEKGSAMHAEFHMTFALQKKSLSEISYSLKQQINNPESRDDALNLSFLSQDTDKQLE